MYEFVNRNTYKLRPNLHVGMKTKPLVAYDPSSYRNRLPIRDLAKPSKNASQIEIGDRT